MPGRKDGAGVVELDRDAIALARHQWRGMFVAVAMREVEHAEADAQRFATRTDVAQPRDEVRYRAVGGDLQAEDIRPACVRGQHTQTLLGELGYSADRILELKRKGVIDWS